MVAVLWFLNLKRILLKKVSLKRLPNLNTQCLTKKYRKIWSVLIMCLVLCIVLLVFGGCSFLLSWHCQFDSDVSVSYLILSFSRLPFLTESQFTWRFMWDDYHDVDSGFIPFVDKFNILTWSRICYPDLRSIFSVFSSPFF